MACLYPITIVNNSDYVNLNAWDVKRVVNCGHCVFCQYARQTEYAIRGYYEYLEVLKHGGYVYWDTLSYNDSWIPTSFGCPCFRKRDVRSFLKTLRLDLKRNYNIGDGAFRYLVVSEYGDKFGRPHYHIMFFVHDPRLTLKLLHYLILKHWRPKHGNTDFHNEPSGRVLTSQAAIYYVTKYLSKLDVRLDKFYKKLNEQIIDSGHSAISRRTFNNHFANWQLHSLGFGSYLLDCPQQQSNVAKLLCSFPTKNNPNKVVPLPTYYKRCRCNGECVLGLYTVDSIESPTGETRRVWRPTTKLYEYQIQTYKDRYINVLTSLNNKVTSLQSIYEKIKDDYPKLVDYVDRVKGLCEDDKGSLSDNIFTIVGSSDLRPLALYVIDRRYRIDVESQLTDDVPSTDIILHRVLDIGSDVNPIKYPRFSPVDDPIEYYSSKCAYDHGFELVLDMISEVYKCYSNSLTISEVNKRLKALELKNGLPLAYKQLY